MVEQCIAPHEIQEGDLVSYLEGVAPTRVTRHVARCPACAAEVEELRLTDLVLQRAFASASNEVVTGRPTAVSSRNSFLSRKWLSWPKWDFQSSGLGPVTAAVGLLLVLVGLQVGLYSLFNRSAEEVPAVAVREGVATVVVTVEETAEMIRKVATRVTGAASIEPGEDEEVINSLTDGRVIMEDMIEIAPPRSLREQIYKELRGITDNLFVYASAVARAERDRVLTGIAGNSYAVWTADQGGQTAIYFVRSDDGGQTWSGSIQINRGLGKVYSPRLAVDTENDNLYVVWRSGYNTNANIYLARSTDSGQTWSKSVRVDGTIGSIFNPSLTVDDAGGVYVSWQNRDRPNINIYFVHSPDGGETWSDRVRVANIGG